jgi:hypothetical protein
VNQETIVWSVVVPVAITLIAAIVGFLIPKGRSQKFQTSFVSICVCIAWLLAIGVALGARQAWAFWPADAWQRAFWPIAATSLILAILHDRDEANSMRWLVACVGCGLTAYVTVPTGEDWQDIFPIHRDWMLLVTISSFSNIWSLLHLQKRDATTWAGWVSTAGIAGSLLFAGGVFAGLAEWIAAALVTTIVATIFTAWPRMAGGASLIYPASLFMASTTATARFYSWDTQSTWVLALILFVPSIVTLIDLPIRNRSGKYRIPIAAATAIILLAVVAWQIYGVAAEPEQW